MERFSRKNMGLTESRNIVEDINHCVTSLSFPDWELVEKNPFCFLLKGRLLLHREDIPYRGLTSSEVFV